MHAVSCSRAGCGARVKGCRCCNGALRFFLEMRAITREVDQGLGAGVFVTRVLKNLVAVALFTV